MAYSVEDARVIKVLVVDDHAIVRQGIRYLLGKYPDISVVGEADNGKRGVQLAGELRPEVVVMDVNMPVMDGIDATREILALHPQTRILMMTMYEDRLQVTKALQAGARGYLLKDHTSEMLVEAVRTLAAGHHYLCPEILSLVIDGYLELVKEAAPRMENSLSPREQEILSLIARGENAKGIAFQLQLTAKTVDNHRQQIMKKLKLNSIADLTRYAVRAGIVRLDG
ncbi:response regulator transcription factor [Geomonas sp. Red32]|uniref:response regulator n=1 Tax=Geomonas sp. Red32 TaxID=2912856 RepID=UPI00202CC188|nr:response regulator transcription factor [Geomonas sp. Red32]MCM0082437.1 response regulator transcription factor [Geomonas sp. Red32]